MSQQKAIALIEPKKGYKTENMIFSNMECPNCNGNGSHSGYSIKTGELETMMCETCQGTGRLMAYVLIKWEPYYE